MDPDQKSADLDVKCFQEPERFGFSRTRVKKEDNLSLAWYYHTSAPAKLKKDKTTTTIMERERLLKKEIYKMIQFSYKNAENNLHQKCLIFTS